MRRAWRLFPVAFDETEAKYERMPPQSPGHEGRHQTLGLLPAPKGSLRKIPPFNNRPFAHHTPYDSPRSPSSAFRRDAAQPVDFPPFFTHTAHMRAANRCGIFPPAKCLGAFARATPAAPSTVILAQPFAQPPKRYPDRPPPFPTTKCGSNPAQTARSLHWKTTF